MSDFANMFLSGIKGGFFAIFLIAAVVAGVMIAFGLGLTLIMATIFAALKLMIYFTTVLHMSEAIAVPLTIAIIIFCYGFVSGMFLWTKKTYRIVREDDA